MKLKFVLIPLVILGLSVGSYADCSKDEVLKLLDKGYSKSEVDGICGKKSQSKWITPSKSVCVANGGKISKGICEASWSNAKEVCHASSGRLPSSKELEKVVTDCGVNIDDSKNNIKDSSYQSCYQGEGFSPYYYWSSITDNSNALMINFYTSIGAFTTKKSRHYVRCIRNGQ